VRLPRPIADVLAGRRQGCVIRGDCLTVMPSLPLGSVDSIVTDPPYGLDFMGKAWDIAVPGVAYWGAALRAAKPGAHLLAFGGTRSFHRLACAIEDAGWEIRDTIIWVYGQGFPKSLDVSKAIDKAAGAKREYGGPRVFPDGTKAHMNPATRHEGWQRPWIDAEHRPALLTSEPATAAAPKWQGWGTALKPAWEPIIVARKPFSRGTVAENVLKHGTGAMNIDACRVAISSEDRGVIARMGGYGKAGYAPPGPRDVLRGGVDGSLNNRPRDFEQSAFGRWPANLVHDGSEEVIAVFGLAGERSSGGTPAHRSGIGYGSTSRGQDVGERRETDSGSAARFFYCAKASNRDRNEGLTETPEVGQTALSPRQEKRCRVCGCRTKKGRDLSCHHEDWEWTDPVGNQRHKGINHNCHPTVKPTALMRCLCRLVTPPGGLVLDPFMGSGSTGKAAVLEGFRFVGIETDAEYCAIARARIRARPRRRKERTW